MSAAENRKIWIGNVPATMTEYQLLQLCREQGELKSFQPFISGSKPAGPYSPRGFAFAEYSTLDEATSAIQSLQGRVVNGCRLKCQFSRPPNTQDKTKKPADIPPVLKIHMQQSSVSITEDERQRKIRVIEEKLKTLKDTTS